ncbi:MAG TPA: HAD family hydrolase [Pseudonocardiaceae bacterium]|nr:HAD family hydrolase [Pseudonocardiaceae bacterium]
MGHVSNRAVVFDYFGTLTPSMAKIITPDERVAMATVLGVDAGELDLAWEQSFVDRFTGRTGDLQATLRLMAGRLGGEPTAADIAEAAGIRTLAYRRSAQPRPETLTVLDTLRERGFRLAVVSDCSDELPEMWPDLPLAARIDTTVFSSQVGRRKPDPLLYRLACEGVGVAAGDCVYVGDGGSGELTGASRFGMRAILMADEHWGSGHRYDADVWHGEVIHSLTDLPDRLS